jgi:hypothetical protein
MDDWHVLGVAFLWQTCFKMKGFKSRGLTVCFRLERHSVGHVGLRVENYVKRDGGK